MSKEDMGASALPTGLSQAEPQEGLGPSGFDPSRVAAGDWLWFVPNGRWKSAQWVRVDSIGRKWVNLISEHGRDIGRAAKGSVFLDGAGYASPGQLFASPEGYEAELALGKQWAAFHEAVSRAYTRPRHLSLEKIDQLWSLFRDSDGSPKGGDSVAGSVRSTTARAGTASPKTSDHLISPSHGGRDG